MAGFHRSGTSLVCRLLDHVGLFLGYELIGANPRAGDTPIKLGRKEDNEW